MVLGLSSRPNPLRPRIVWAILRRDYRIRRSYRLAFALEMALTIVNILTFFFISRTFPGATESLGGAPSYFAFAAVGVVITTVMQATATGLALKLREEQLTGTLEMLAGQPLSPAEIAAGLGGYPFMMGMGRAVAYLGFVGVALGADLSEASWLGTALALTATSLTVTCFGIVVGALVLVVKRAEMLAGLSVFALALLGGAFFPISVLPGWLESIAAVAPSRYVYEGVRNALFLGDEWLGAVSYLGVFCLIGLPLALAAFDLALRSAKQRGTLSQY